MSSQVNDATHQHISADETWNDARFKPLRTWPPILLMVGMVVTRLIPSTVQDGPENLWMLTAFGPALCGLLVLLWWIALSRATGLERLAGFVGVIVALIATVALIDATMRGPAITVVTLPMGMAAFAIGATVLGGRLSFQRTVIVHAGGAGDKGILAFDIDTGKLSWSAAAGDHSYSSPQLAKIDNGQTAEELILMPTNTGINLLDSHTGKERLNYEWKHAGYRSRQPQVVDGNSILLPTGMGTGTRRIRVVRNEHGWSAEEQWTSRYLKPDFNDFVVFQNHA